MVPRPLCGSGTYDRDCRGGGLNEATEGCAEFELHGAETCTGDVKNW